MSIKYKNDGYLQLFSCCIPVRGAKRSIICDLQRGDFIFIPNIFYEIFSSENKNITYEELILKYDEYENFENDFNEVVNVLLEKELVFFTNEPLNFPPIQNDILSPSRISNAIIEVEDKINFDLKKFVLELSKARCLSVLIRIFKNISSGYLLEILKEFEDSTIRSIELVIPVDDYLDTPLKVKELFKLTTRVNKVTIFNSKSVNKLFKEDYIDILYTEFSINKENCCGNISPYYFSVNNSTFFEAQKHNSCLNKKISIDTKGRIKNCPSMEKHFGRFDDIETLNNILEDDAFTNLWGINKDQINICKDCEFRYICHDCRAFVENKDDLRSKPLTCSYDPYEAIWK